jgi:uncharacterized membrane protein YcjF (UPF0283 family)
MYFDWFTWGIWLIGFIILIVWITVPIREFRSLARRHREEKKQRDFEGLHS